MYICKKLYFVQTAKQVYFNILKQIYKKIGIT